MSRILNVSEQLVIKILTAKGFSIRRIARELGVNRRTVARYAGPVGSKCTSAGGEVTAGFAVEAESKCCSASG